MAAFWTFVRDQPILVDHWSDGHHIFHRSPAFGARRNCVLASGSWLRCHNTRLLLVLPIVEQRRACSLVRRKGQSTLNFPWNMIRGGEGRTMYRIICAATMLVVTTGHAPWRSCRASQPCPATWICAQSGSGQGR